MDNASALSAVGAEVFAVAPAREEPQAGAFEAILERSRTLICEYLDETAEGRPLLDRLGSFTALGELGIVNPASARAFAEDALARTPNQLHHVWDLLNVETWVRCS